MTDVFRYALAFALSAPTDDVVPHMEPSEVALWADNGMVRVRLRAEAYASFLTANEGELPYQALAHAVDYARSHGQLSGSQVVVIAENFLAYMTQGTGEPWRRLLPMIGHDA